jgi:hypothetical protein
VPPGAEEAAQGAASRHRLDFQHDLESAPDRNANVRLGRVQITFKTINDAIFSVETIVGVYVAARLALDNVMTVGMIIAFMSYKQQFVERAVMLVEKRPTPSAFTAMFVPAPVPRFCTCPSVPRPRVWDSGTKALLLCFMRVFAVPRDQ